MATPALKKQVSSKLQEEWDKEIPPASFLRLLKVNAPEWWLIIIGVLAAIVNGSVFPVYSILFGEVLRVFQMPPDEVLEGITPWASLFLALATGSAIAIFFKVSRLSGDTKYMYMYVIRSINHNSLGCKLSNRPRCKNVHVLRHSCHTVNTRLKMLHVVQNYIYKKFMCWCLFQSGVVKRLLYDL